MGQKTHPKGFRLITTQNHLSSWYKEKLAYKSSLEEDHEIRTVIEKYLKDFVPVSLIEIARANSSNQRIEHVEILVSALFPGEREIAKRLTALLTDTTKTEEKETTDGDSFSVKEMIKKKKIQKELILDEDKINDDEFVSLKDAASAILHEKLRCSVAYFQKKTNKVYKIQLNLIENQFEDARLIARFVAEQLIQRVPFRRTLKQVIQKVHQTTGKGIKIEISGRLNGADIARSEWKREGKVPLHTLNAKIDYTHQTAQTTSGTLGIKVWLFTP